MSTFNMLSRSYTHANVNTVRGTQPVNKNSAIANRSRVSCAHNTL